MQPQTHSTPADTRVPCRACCHVSTQVGAALGVAAAGYLLKDESGAKPLHFLGAAGAGAATGVLLHMLTRPVDQKTPNKMMHELRN